MGQRYILAIDIGTQGCKTALFNTEGCILAAVFAPAKFRYLDHGIIEQDPLLIYRDVMDTIQAVIQKSNVSARDIAVVGVDGQMAGIVGIDEDFNPVTAYDSGLDKRCEESIVKMQEMAEEKVIGLTGCPIIVAQGAKMYWWKEWDYESYRRSKKIIPISSFVCGKMTGLKAKDAYIDYTHIHLTCLADTKAGVWSDELIELFQMDQEKLPLIKAPWEVIGTVTAACSTASGLPAGIPVIAGCGDTPASTLGAGIVTDHLLLDISGTATVLTAGVNRYVPDVTEKVLIYPRSILPDFYNPFGFVLGGQSMDWYLKQTGDQNSFEQIDRLAESVSTDGLYFLPFFAGRICPSNPRYAGTWAGMKFHHNTAHMHRSIMEAIAYEYRFYMESMKRLVPDLSIKGVVSIGGGSKSAVFRQIKSDVLGLPFYSLNQKDTALFAVAVTAGYGAGLYKNISETVTGLCKITGETLPSVEKEESYHMAYLEYQSLVRFMEGLYI